MTKPKSPTVDTSQDATFNRELAVQYIAPPVHLTMPYKFTWVPDKPDTRDHSYKLKGTTAARVDLRPYCSPVEDQGNLGSCTGHATSSAMELILKRKNKLTEISRLFIYYQARLMEGTVKSDAGAYIRDCVKSCNKLGAPAESLWSYDAKKFAVNPVLPAYTDATKRRVTGYQRCADFTAVKDALTAGNPVIIGFNVYSSFLSAGVTKTGMMSYPNTRSERLLGGHAVCLVGYDDSTNRFIAKNSWGTLWGDRGYFYMPYSVIQNTNMSGDFWVISDVAVA